jgi:hypothetical protein
MWDNFFEAGGWGMYPTLLFGFALLAVTGMSVFRREARYERAAQVLSGTTFYSGLLGTCVGLSNSVHYMKTVPPEKQLEMLALGAEESLHVVILGLILVTLAGLIRAVATFRMRADER